MTEQQGQAIIAMLDAMGRLAGQVVFWLTVLVLVVAALVTIQASRRAV